MADLNFKVDFKTNTSGLQSAKKELETMKKTIDQLSNNTADTKININTKELDNAKKNILALESALEKAFDFDTGTLNLKKLTNELKKQGSSLSDLQSEWKKIGIDSNSVLQDIQREAVKTGVEIKRVKSSLELFGETFIRAIRWNIADEGVRSIATGAQKAVAFLQDLDESLNNIRVVTGKNTKEMEVFKEEANEMAKALGRTTTEYTDASLIFFQQGKTAEEVRHLTEATLMGANVTGMEAAETADLLTAVMNGYTIEANKALEVTDKLAAVGAATGSDFEEMAIGMSKVASMANVAGVDIDQLGAQLATITTVTREAPESIGTSLKTIFGRIAEVKAGGEDEEGWTLGKVEQAFNKVGMTVLTTNGQMKDTGAIIEEVGAKWETFDRASKMALANAMAGQRQANRLIALFENWDMYLEAREISENALGATMEQNLVRMDSMSYKIAQLKASAEDLYSTLANEDFLKSLIDSGANALDTINNLIEGIGGVQNAILLLTVTIGSKFSKGMALGLEDAGNKLERFSLEVENLKSKFGKSNSQQDTDLPYYLTQEEKATLLETKNEKLGSDYEQLSYDIVLNRSKIRQQEENIQKSLTEKEAEEYKLAKDKLFTEQETLKTLVKQRELKRKEAEEALAKDIFKNKASMEEVTIDDLNKELEILKNNKRSIEEDIAFDNKKMSLVNSLLRDFRPAETLADYDSRTKRTPQIDAMLKDLKDIDMPFDELLQDEEKLRNQLLKYRDMVNHTLEESREGLEGILEYEKQIQIVRSAREKTNASVEEQYIQEQIQKSNEELDRLENISQKRQRLQIGIQTIATSIGAIVAVSGALKTLTQEAATTEEKVNALTSSGAALTGMLLMLIPNLGSVKAMLAVGIVAGAIGAATAFTKLRFEMDEVNIAARKNQKILEEQNKILDESKQRISGLREVQSAYTEVQQMASLGISEQDTETMEKFISLQNQIASQAPELVQYYDEQGNAVLDLTANFNKLIETEQQLQRTSQQIKKDNREGFVKEYANEIKDLQKQINSNQQILEKLRTQETYRDSKTGKKYDASDIGALTSEISVAQKKISDFGSKVQTDIVAPMFEASEAYSNLTEQNKQLSRGLYTTSVVMDSLNNPEGLERYSNAVDRFIDSLNSKTEPLKTKLEDIKSKIEEIKNSDSPDKDSVLQQLNTQAQELQNKIEAVSSPIANLSEQNRIHVIEMSGFVQQQIKDYDTLISKLTEYYSSVEQLSRGPLTYNQLVEMGGGVAEPLVSNIGVDKRGEQIYKENQMNQNVYKEQIATLESEKASFLDSTVAPSAMSREELQILEDYNAKIREQQELLDQISMSRGEASIQARVELMEEKALQEEITQTYWDQIEALTQTAEGYNQVAEAYRLSIEAQGDASSTMEEVNEILQESFLNGDSWEEVREALGGYIEDIEGLEEVLSQGAETGVDSLKSLLSQYNDIADQQGKLYAKLKGNDKDYYKQFLKDNENVTKLIELEYGVRADDYQSYNEFEKKLAEAQKGQKIRIIDDETRAKILAGDKQALAAWGLAQEETNASATASNNIMQNNAITAENVVNNLETMKNAGVSAWDRLRYAFAVVADSIINGMRTTANAVMSIWNNIISFVSGTIRTVANAIPSFLSPVSGALNSLANGIDSWKGNANRDTNTTKYTDKVVNSIIDKYEKPEYDFNYGGGTVPNQKVGTSSGVGGSAPTTSLPISSGGGGKDKKDSKDKEKEVEDMEWEKDIYHDINNLIERKSKLIDKLQDQEDKLYGDELLKNLQQQQIALQEQQKLLKQKLELQKTDAKQQAALLQQQGVIINSTTGMIENYNQIIESKVNAANRLTGEAKEQAKEDVEEFIDALEKYEDLVNDEMWSVMEEIRDLADEEREKYLEEFNFKINVQLEMSEEYQDALEFHKNMDSALEEVSLNMERTAKQFQDFVSLAKGLEEQMKKIENDTSLSDKERIENMQMVSEELKKAVEGMKDMDELMTELFVEGLEEGLDLIQEQVKEFENMYDELNHISQMVKLLGEEDNYSFLQELYANQAGVLGGQIDILLKQKDVLENERQALEAAGLKGTEEWKALNEAIVETTQSIDKLTQDTIKALQNEYKTAIEEILNTLENTLTKDLGFDKIKDEFKKQQEEQKKYLDLEEKLLGISKLQSKVQKELEETEDPARKAKLQQFLDQEIKKLKEKDKLSEYDLERANKLYDLTLRQMALEDQQAAKDTMRLVRDSQGNWTYEFTEDYDAIQQAKEEASQSLEELHQYDKENLDKIQSEMIALQEEYYKIIQQLAQDNLAGKFANEEEYRKALEEATAEFEENMAQLNQEYAEIKTNTTISSLGVMLEAYGLTSEELEGLTEEQQEALHNLANAIGGDYLALQGYMESIINGDSDSMKASLDKLAQIAGTDSQTIQNALNNAITTAQKQWNTSIGDMIHELTAPDKLKDTTDKTVESMLNKWEEYQSNVNKVTQATGNDFNSLKDRIDTVDKKTDELTQSNQALVDKFGAVMKSISQLATSYGSHRTEIQKTIDKYQALIGKIDEAIRKKQQEANQQVLSPTPSTPSSSSTSSSSSSNSSGASSSSGGTQGNGRIDKGDRVKVRSSNANAWYTATGREVAPWYKQAQAVGKSWNDDFYVYNTKNNRVALSKSPGEMALAWVNQNDLQGFDTGGYTGAWGKEGKLAMLHEKEIVLNKQDTKNILDVVKLVRNLDLTNIHNTIFSTVGSILKSIAPSRNDNIVSSQNQAQAPISQDITINADFSGVQSAKEIQEAFKNIENMASQYANREF